MPGVPRGKGSALRKGQALRRKVLTAVTPAACAVGAGYHAMQLARSSGAEIIAVTQVHKKVERLESYADHVVLAVGGRFDDQLRARKIRPQTIIDLTAKFTLANNFRVANNFRAVARGGTVVILRNLHNGNVEVLRGSFIAREIRLLGSKPVAFRTPGRSSPIVSRSRTPDDASCRGRKGS